MPHPVAVRRRSVRFAAIVASLVAIAPLTASAARAQNIGGSAMGCFPGAIGCDPATGGSVASLAGLHFTGTSFSVSPFGGEFSLGRVQLFGSPGNARCGLTAGLGCLDAFSGGTFQLLVAFDGSLGAGSTMFTAALGASFDVRCPFPDVCSANVNDGQVTLALGASRTIAYTNALGSGTFQLTLAGQRVTVAERCTRNPAHRPGNGLPKLLCTVDSPVVELTGRISDTRFTSVPTTNPPVDPPTNPPVIPPTNPPVDPPIIPPTNPPVDPPIIPPTNPPVDPNPPHTVTPEPGTMALLATGLVALAGIGSRRRRSRDRH